MLGQGSLCDMLGWYGFGLNKRSDLTQTVPNHCIEFRVIHFSEAGKNLTETLCPVLPNPIWFSGMVLFALSY